MLLFIERLIIVIEKSWQWRNFETLLNHRTIYIYKYILHILKACREGFLGFRWWLASYILCIVFILYTIGLRIYKRVIMSDNQLSRSSGQIPGAFWFYLFTVSIQNYAPFIYSTNTRSHDFIKKKQEIISNNWIF